MIAPPAISPDEKSTPGPESASADSRSIFATERVVNHPGACDLLENTVHLSFLSDRRNITRLYVLVGNGAALLKWTIAAGALVAVVGLALRARALQRAGAPT